MAIDPKGYPKNFATNINIDQDLEIHGGPFLESRHQFTISRSHCFAGGSLKQTKTGPPRLVSIGSLYHEGVIWKPSGDAPGFCLCAKHSDFS